MSAAAKPELPPVWFDPVALQSAQAKADAAVERFTASSAAAAAATPFSWNVSKPAARLTRRDAAARADKALLAPMHVPAGHHYPVLELSAEDEDSYPLPFESVKSRGGGRTAYRTCGVTVLFSPDDLKGHNPPIKAKPSTDGRGGYFHDSSARAAAALERDYLASAAGADDGSTVHVAAAVEDTEAAVAAQLSQLLATPAAAAGAGAYGFDEWPGTARPVPVKVFVGATPPPVAAAPASTPKITPAATTALPSTRSAPPPPAKPVASAPASAVSEPAANTGSEPVSATAYRMMLLGVGSTDGIDVYDLQYDTEMVAGRPELNVTASRIVKLDGFVNARSVCVAPAAAIAASALKRGKSGVDTTAVPSAANEKSEDSTRGGGVWCSKVVYVSEQHRIRRFRITVYRDGSLSCVPHENWTVGSLTAGYSETALGTKLLFDTPLSATVDPMRPERVYVCDSKNHRIRMINSLTRTSVTVAGNGLAGCTDDFDWESRKPNKAGAATAVVGAGRPGTGMIRSPLAICFDTTAMHAGSGTRLAYISSGGTHSKLRVLMLDNGEVWALMASMLGDAMPKELLAIIHSYAAPSGLGTLNFPGVGARSQKWYPKGLTQSPSGHVFATCWISKHASKTTHTPIYEYYRCHKCPREVRIDAAARVMQPIPEVCAACGGGVYRVVDAMAEAPARPTGPLSAPPKPLFQVSSQPHVPLDPNGDPDDSDGDHSGSDDDESSVEVLVLDPYTGAMERIKRTCDDDRLGALEDIFGGEPSTSTSKRRNILKLDGICLDTAALATSGVPHRWLLMTDGRSDSVARSHVVIKVPVVAGAFNPRVAVPIEAKTGAGKSAVAGAGFDPFAAASGVVGMGAAFGEQPKSAAIDELNEMLKSLTNAKRKAPDAEFAPETEYRRCTNCKRVSVKPAGICPGCGASKWLDVSADDEAAIAEARASAPGFVTGRVEQAIRAAAEEVELPPHPNSVIAQSRLRAAKEEEEEVKSAAAIVRAAAASITALTGAGAAGVPFDFASTSNAPLFSWDAGGGSAATTAAAAAGGGAGAAAGVAAAIAASGDDADTSAFWRSGQSFGGAFAAANTFAFDATALATVAADPAGHPAGGGAGAGLPSGAASSDDPVYRDATLAPVPASLFGASATFGLNLNATDDTDTAADGDGMSALDAILAAAADDSAAAATATAATAKKKKKKKAATKK